MSATKTQVYFVPGMAAGKEIFKNIVLPEDLFEMHILDWFIPEKNESVTALFWKEEHILCFSIWGNKFQKNWLLS